jgi:hypothetical protein
MGDERDDQAARPSPAWGLKGPHDNAAPHPFVPYLVVLGLALVFALGLAGYVWLYRDELARILTQSPT